jgi:hypothetical protein
MNEVRGLRTEDGYHVLTLGRGDEIRAGAAIVATGVSSVFELHFAGRGAGFLPFLLLRLRRSGTVPGEPREPRRYCVMRLNAAQDFIARGVHARDRIRARRSVVHMKSRAVAVAHPCASLSEHVTNLTGTLFRRFESPRRRQTAMPTLGVTEQEGRDIAHCCSYRSQPSTALLSGEQRHLIARGAIARSAKLRDRPPLSLGRPHARAVDIVKCKRVIGQGERVTRYSGQEPSHAHSPARRPLGSLA